MFVLTRTILTFLQPTRAHVYTSVHMRAYAQSGVIQSKQGQEKETCLAPVAVK